MTSSDDGSADENFSYSEEESVSSLDLSPQPPIQQPSGAPTAVQGAVGHATAAVQAAVGRAATAVQGTAGYVTAAMQDAVGYATTAVQGTAGYVATMHYYFEFEDAAVENIAASDHHQVSHGLPRLPHLVGFGEDVSSDVEEPAVDVDACKADHFVGDEAEKVLEGEKRGGGGEGWRWRGGEADLEFLLHATGDGEASMEDLLDQVTDHDEEGGNSLYLCMFSLTLTFII